MNLRACMICGLVIGSALLPRSLWADGIYIPDRAYKKPPTIPHQRALLVYRDGQERLIIESALDAEGQAFGWLMALPAKPTAFEASTAGLLTTLEHVTQPRITHDVWPTLKYVCIVCAVVVVLAVLPPGRMLDYLLVLVLVFLLSALLLPHLGTTRAGRGSTVGVTLLQASRVGSYDLSLLEADGAPALNRWLEANGFAALPAEGELIVDDYIRRGWAFVAAKLRREGTGLCVPHPLSMTFPAKTAIYPMRLTSLTGAPVALDLYVLAEQQAKTEGLRTDYCDVFLGPHREYDWFPLDGRQGNQPGFRGRSYPPWIGHPDLVNLMWDRSVLTKLSADVATDAMRKDIELSFCEAVPYRPHVFSDRGAWGTGLLWVLPCGSVVLLILMVGKRKRLRARRGQWFGLTRIALPVVVASALATSLVYLILPRVPVSSLNRMAWYYWRSQLSQLDQRRQDFLGPPRKTAEDVRERVAQHFRQAATKNPFTGEPVREEDSPGNFTILETPRGVTVRVYNEFGFPGDLTLQAPEDR